MTEPGIIKLQAVLTRLAGHLAALRNSSVPVICQNCRTTGRLLNAKTPSLYKFPHQSNPRD